MNAITEFLDIADDKACECGLGPGLMCHPDCPAYKKPPPGEITGIVKLSHAAITNEEAADYGNYSTYRFLGTEQPQRVLQADSLRRRASLCVTEILDISAATVYGQGVIVLGTVAGTVLVSIPASSLPAGRYEVRVQSYLSAATTPSVADNLQVTVGTQNYRLQHLAAIVNSLAYDFKAAYVVNVDVDGNTAISVTNVAPEVGANSQTHNIAISATRIASVGPAVLLGSERQIFNNSGMYLPADTLFNMSNKQELWAKPLQGVDLSVYNERWDSHK